MTVSAKTILTVFSKIVRHNRLAHAYLFVGPKQSGKKTAALQIAKFLNCAQPFEDNFCGKCSSCLKIHNQSHPDMYDLWSNEDSIKIEDIRKITERTQMRAHEAKKKVFILNNVENLTLESGNALLKTLEEPAANSLLILTTSLPEKILGTIRSRCQILYFYACRPQQLEKEVMADYHQSPEIAHFLAYCYEDRLKAMNPRDFGDIIKRKNKAIDQFFFSSDSEQYIKDILKDKRQAKETLWFIFCWVKDLLLIKQEADQCHVVHRDRWVDLKKNQSRFSINDLQELLSDVVGATRAVDDFFNVSIPFTLIKEKAWRE
jgi:DNA polymerase III subunit delta'